MPQVLLVSSSNAKAVTMSLKLCDLQICLGGQYTLFLNQDVISQYSGSLKKMIKKAKKKRNKTENVQKVIEIDDFPGGSDGFELVLRFCYSNSRIAIDVTNVSLLYCCSVFLEMTEEFSSSNLLLQAQKFLEGMFINWSWNDILICLKSCERIFAYADSYGLVQKLICAVLAKIIDQNSSDVNGFVISPSSSSSSPETTARGQRRFSLSSRNTTPESTFSCRISKEWWFDDLMILGPQTIEKLIMNLGRRGYGSNEDSLIITRFLLQYLKTRVQYKSNRAELAEKKQEYGGLADRAVQGVIFEGKSAFSCRKLFWVLRVCSEFSVSRESRMGLETLIGEILDQATLDDLLISGCSSDDKCFYNVDLVIRIVKVFASNSQESSQNLKTMGNLIDKYLREISPDQNLKVLKFVGVAESLPDSARDCFDGVYRAIDIYLESHPNLSSEERTKLCRSLNYEKLTLETCKELAKNPKIPPNVAVQALKSQHFRIPKTKQDHQYAYDHIAIPIMDKKITSCHDRKKSSEITYSEGFEDRFEDEGEDVRMNLERMQWRVGELEKVCKDMKVRMSKLASHGHTHSSGSPQNRALPRLC